MMEAMQALTVHELAQARLLVWEEVKDAPEGSVEREVWSGLLSVLVLEAARRAGEPVGDLAAVVRQLLRQESDAASELAWRRVHDALGVYASGKAGMIQAQGPAGIVEVRALRLQAFWLAVQRFLEGGSAA